MIVIYTHFVRQSYYIMNLQFMIVIYTHFVRQSYYIMLYFLTSMFLYIKVKKPLAYHVEFHTVRQWDCLYYASFIVSITALHLFL